MHLIVGIDTGKTCAVSCLDLNGRLVHATHKTFAGTEWFVSVIKDVGIPSLVACDKEPNDVARKVAASFNTRLFYPKKEMASLEKRQIARPFGLTNRHEMDALSGAVKAFNRYSNKLHQAEHISKSKKVEDIDAIKAKIIKRYSIDEAITNKAANRR
jgi:predicted RNase H-like nuclease (RuvC/YqgF family)